MEKIIVYLDNADHALQQLVPMTGAAPRRDEQAATQWILVACAPRMSKHISKWMSRTARNHWRAQWSNKVFAQITPTLAAQGDQIDTVLAEGDLPSLTERLVAQYGGARVMDARCPKFGQDLQPITRNQPVRHDSRWSVPGTLAGMGALLVLAND